MNRDQLIKINMKKFELKEFYAPYASGNNPSVLSVGDRLPKKIVWSSEGKEFALECSDGLVAKIFEPNIFVIESPYEIKKNRAYVLSADCHLVADLPKEKGGLQFYYYDILLRGSEVIFLASSHNGDFQLSVDLVSGAVISIREFR